MVLRTPQATQRCPHHHCSQAQLLTKPEEPTKTQGILIGSRRPPPIAKLVRKNLPPDEDPSGPKRVAVSERSILQTLSDPPSQYDNNHDNSHLNNTPHVATDVILAQQQHATVAHTPCPLTSSTPPRHRAEPEGNPQPIIPEENMGVSASQPAKLHSMVLTHRNLNIYNLNRFIIKQLYTIHKIISHHHHTNYNISHNDYWHKVRSMLHATISTSETEEGIIQPAMDILLHCIDTHYDRLIETRFQLIEQQIINTYHIINNNNRVDSEDATTTTTTRDIQASISYLLHQLREQAPITYKNTPESAYTSQDDTENVDTSLTTINASSSITENSNTTPVDIGEQNNDNGHTTVPASNNRSTLTNDNNNNNNNSNTQKQNRKSQKDRTKLKKNHTPEHCTSRNCYECATNNIVNLSNIQLTKTQVLLLNRGLSFVPTADNAKPMELIKEFDIFANKAKRKLRQMVNPPKPPRPNDEPALFRKPTNPRDTNSTPQTLGPRILEDTFQAIKLEITNLNKTLLPHITLPERRD